MKILLISDVHANIEALNSILDTVGGYDYIVYLGDLVDYGPSPAETIDKLKELDPIIVKGNHDEAVAYNIDCRCGEATHWLSIYTREKISLKNLGKEDIKYLRSLPEHRLIDIDNLKIFVVHASPSNPLYGYLYPWRPKHEILKMLKPTSNIGLLSEIRYDILLYGHTHHQCYINVDGVKIVNPGSVGQPRDYDWRAAAAILDTNKNIVSFIRVKYNVNKVIQKLSNLIHERSVLEALKTILMKGAIPTT